VQLVAWLDNIYNGQSWKQAENIQQLVQLQPFVQQGFDILQRINNGDFNHFREEMEKD